MGASGHAGMVWADKPGATWDKGATGYGVRLLDQLIRDNYQARLEIFVAGSFGKKLNAG